MKLYLLPIIMILVVGTVISAGAVRIANEPITGKCADVYQAYEGSSSGQGACLGYNGVGADPIEAAPGILSIVPGTGKDAVGNDGWPNFIAAAQQGDPYIIKDTQLTKVVPTVSQCMDIFARQPVVQHGTKNIRLWWPLMYEVPGTKWTLNILWSSLNPKTYPGEPAGPPSTVHQNRWTWELKADVASLKNVIKLFHQIAWGTYEVPLISDEDCYAGAIRLIDAVAAASTPAAQAAALADFEMFVADCCMSNAPRNPYPTGGAARNLGIVMTPENPACCKLLVDAGYLFASGIGQPGK